MQFGNFIGLKGKFSIEPTSFEVSYTLPSGKKINSVNISRPDTNDTSQTALQFTQSGNTIRFKVKMQQYAMVLIAFEGAVPPKNNHTPVAGNDELSTAKATPLTFSSQLLLANDGDLDGDKLTIDQLDLPSSSGGTLSVNNGEYTYTPAAKFTGVDNLMYRISDGQGGTDMAALDIYVGSNTTPSSSEEDKPILSVSNPVSSNIFTLDANLSDWQYLQSFGKDGDDIQQSKPEGDWLEAWMAHDDSNLYIAYQNDGAINQAKWWLWAIYLDTDNDKSTGFRIHKNMGADYFFNGGSFWRYTGTGLDWGWEVVSAKTQHKVQGDIAEMRIPLNLAEMGSTLRVLFQADNLVTQDNKESSVTDSYPNQANGYFTYHLATSSQQPIAYHDAVSVSKNSHVDILLNGNDAQNKTLSYRITTQPTKGKLTGMGANRRYVPNSNFIGKDSFRFKVNNGQDDSVEAHVNINITAGIPNNGGVEITLDGNASDWETIQAFSRDAQEINAPNARIDWIKAQLAHNQETLYLGYQNHYPIDSTKWWLWETYLDSDANAKTGYQLNNKLGAEYVLQGNTLYRYTGSGENWQWSPVKSLKYGIADKFAEVAIPRTLINNPTQLRIAFFGNNASYVDTPKQYENEAIDFYPETQTGYFQYNLN